MQIFHKLAQVACLILAVLMIGFSVHAQTTTGVVRGIVKDPAGAIVPGAGVTIVSNQTGQTANAQTTGGGEFQFSDLLPGDYKVTVTASNFKVLTLNDVRVQLNQITDLPAQLEAGLQGETVEVSAGGAELVDTTTTTLAKSFNERQAVELAQTGIGLNGVNNLSLIAPNVSSSGGVGVGTGGSVGGQRPRNNNFVVDGIDNNDKSVTGPQAYISPENVAEFSLLQNQFSAEFVRSNGGQFITITKSGTNNFHGALYGFFRNRNLNALDTLEKAAGVVRDKNPAPGLTRIQRTDFFRGGFNVGGPFIIPRSDEGGRPAFSLAKDRLFFYTGYERRQFGQASAPGGITGPTTAGLAIINGFPGLSATNLGVFNAFVPVAPTNDAGNITLCRVARDAAGNCPAAQLVNVPIGNVTFAAPNFTKQNNFVINIDFVQSTKTAQRARFNYTNVAAIDNQANLPVFFASAPNKQRLFVYTLTHSFTSNVSNETRISYRRSTSATPAGGGIFPGLDSFPNIQLDDLGINVGPDPNAPQFNIENNYQVVNNVSYLRGSQSFKFGGDYRRIISPQTFVQRQRGDYQYSSTELFLRDISPDELAERNVGTAPYAGDQHIFFAFAQDDYRIRPNLTLNLGVNYSFQSVPRGAQEQSRNIISNVPGLLDFSSPRPQKKNFAPKVGVAYAPDFNSGLLGRVFGSSGKSSIRAGFSLGYDYIFDNLYILSSPPQAQQTASVDPAAGLPNFLANGGILNNPIPITSAAAARSATGSFIPNQLVPYSITYTLSMQRQFAKDYSVEVRYLGTRGVHLLTQNRINRQAKASPEFGGLPTFLTAPSQAQLDALPLTLDAINARSNFVPRFANAGFNQSSLVGFLSNGNSTYQGGSVSLQKRLSRGFLASAAYTYSHLIDDTTAEVFSTVLSPRRVQDFQNLTRERADSALDRRQRFVFSSNYDLPFFNRSENRLVRGVLGGFSFAGTLTFESGEKATVLSGRDANLNGDSAPDRTIRNPNGVRNTGSEVRTLTNTAGQVVGYVAINPNAEYIRAGSGAIANSARNTLQLPGINNLDFSVFKNFRFFNGESRKKFQLRADFYNAFNHPQYVPGSVNDVTPIATTGVNQINTVNAANLLSGSFNNPSQVFSSNPRRIQLSGRFEF